jgi:hypothetical protein
MAAARKHGDSPRPASPGRFVATIYPGRHSDLAGIRAMGLDVVPSRDAEVHALVSIGECIALLDAGYEVRLHHHYPIEPVDPSLIATDSEARRWLKSRLAEIRPEVTQGKSPGRSGR